MKNPFQNIDNYSIKTHYNRIRSRTKSKDQSKSSKLPNTYYGPSKLKQFIVGVQYRQKWNKIEQLQRKSLQIYGPQSMRYNSKKYASQSPPKQYNDYLQSPKILIPSKKIINSDHIVRRDSQLTEMINIGSFPNIQSSNEYGSYYNINDSKHSLIQNKMRNINRQCSIMQSKDPFKSFDESQLMANSRTKDESIFYQSKYTANSNRYLQNDHIPEAINQTSQTISNKGLSNNHLSNKSIKSSLKSISAKSIQNEQKPRKISVHGKEYYFSQYYKN